MNTFVFVCASSYFIVILYRIRVFTNEPNNKLKLKKQIRFLWSISTDCFQIPTPPRWDDCSPVNDGNILYVEFASTEYKFEKINRKTF